MNPQTLESYLSGRWTRGEGVETSLVDPVTRRAARHRLGQGPRPQARARLRAQAGAGRLCASSSYAERAKLLGAVADSADRQPRQVRSHRDREFRQHQGRRCDRHRRRHRHAEILCAARRGARRGAHAARREAGAARQGGKLPGHPPDGAAPRRRRPHQRVQLPELGPVGEGGGVAARRRARARQAGLGDRAARASQMVRDVDRREGAARRRAQPAGRRRRRPARPSHLRRRHRLHRLGRHGGARARPPQRGGAQRAA